jgi:predicted nucleotidyltransferase
LNYFAFDAKLYPEKEEIIMKNDENTLIIKQFINEVIPYEKEIIFFGSRISSVYREDSDYDILVIVHGGHMNRKTLIASQAKIKRLCARFGLDADVIVRDKAHAQKMKHFPGNIIHSALQAGIHI